jgi:TetR/AcrR family transcriptional repressor of nem operon
MGRVSQAQARENRKRIVETASRLFRERGVAGVSVADVMAEVGLTHGGFYKQFASKEALVAEAVGQAFAELSDNLQDQDRDDFVRGYLSPAHRDNPGPGCPAAGFAGDLAHEQGAHADQESGAAVDAYTKGIGLYAAELGSLADVATLVGAMILARATAGTELSDRILDEVRAKLLSGA